MSTQEIGALIDSVNEMTQTVANKNKEIDKHLQESTEQINLQLEQTKFMLPRIAVTRNQALVMSETPGLPSDFQIHSDVTSALHMAISNSPSSRTPEQIALLQEMEADMGCSLRTSQHYIKGFNVIKLSWSAGSGAYLAFPKYIGSADPIPLNTFFTIGAFVKVLTGSLGEEAWGKGNRLGKWTFCSNKYEPIGFGAYSHLHPYRRSEVGEVLVALPAAVTGHIASPENWFPNIETV